MCSLRRGVLLSALLCLIPRLGRRRRHPRAAGPVEALQRFCLCFLAPILKTVTFSKHSVCWFRGAATSHSVRRAWCARDTHVSARIRCHVRVAWRCVRVRCGTMAVMIVRFVAWPHSQQRCFLVPSPPPVVLTSVHMGFLRGLLGAISDTEIIWRFFPVFFN